MAEGHNLSVSISADVADLQAKMAIAGASARAFGADMRSLAEQVRTASAEQRAQLAPALQAAAAGYAHAQASARAYSAAMRGVGEETKHADGLFGAIHESVRLTGERLETLNFRMAEYTSLASKFGELLLVGFGAERILELARGAMEFGEQLEFASAQTGLTTEQLQVLNYQAQLVGVDFATVERAISRFATNVQQAQRATGVQREAFEALGISQQMLAAHGNDAGAMLALVAERLDRYAPGMNRAAIESAIFGQRIGPELQPLLDRLARGIQAVTEEATNAGVVLGHDAVSQLAEGAQAVKRFDAQWQILKERLALTFTPSGITIALSTGAVTVTGGDVIADGVSLKTHVHSGVQAGGDDTGPPVA